MLKSDCELPIQLMFDKQFFQTLLIIRLSTSLCSDYNKIEKYKEECYIEALILWYFWGI